MNSRESIPLTMEEVLLLTDKLSEKLKQRQAMSTIGSTLGSTSGMNTQVSFACERNKVRNQERIRQLKHAADVGLTQAMDALSDLVGAQDNTELKLHIELYRKVVDISDALDTEV